MMPTALARTPLHDWHVAHGGRMVDFAGWSMPVQYTSIVEEHNATRNAVGVFDISHMGRLHFVGPNVAEFLGHIATRRIDDMKSGQVRYSLVCNDKGGILDDILIYYGYRDGPEFLVVVNASNRVKIVDWLNQQAAQTSRFADVVTIDATTRTAMIAIQGPGALTVLGPRVKLASANAGMPLSGIRNYFAAHGVLFETFDVAISRTGYTGEDGFEIICEKKDAGAIWERVLDDVARVGGRACALGARDTLRLEAAMPLYGHELSETINPIQAGLKFAVNLENRKFIGSEALQRFASDKSQPARIGLELGGKRVAREGSHVYQGNRIIGEVTSGTFSPTLQRSIAMAYVEPTAQTVGNTLSVDIRGTQHSAVVVPLPFYSRKKN